MTTEHNNREVCVKWHAMQSEETKSGTSEKCVKSKSGGNWMQFKISSLGPFQSITQHLYSWIAGRSTQLEDRSG